MEAIKNKKLGKLPFVERYAKGLASIYCEVAGGIFNL